MHTAVSSYSFWKYLTNGSMDIFQVVKTAAEIGFEGMELCGLGPSATPENSTELAKQIKDACAKAGLPIVSYTIGADFLNSSAGSAEAEAIRLREEVDIAVILGAPRMRHDATGGYRDRKNGLLDFIEALPIIANACREVTKYAADKGVKTMVENHGFFMQDSDRVEALTQTVDHPNFGALVDIGNFLCADEEPLVAVNTMAKYAFHVHAKDFHVKPFGSDPGGWWFKSRGGHMLRGTVVGHGNVDIRGCMKILKDAGYNDYVSIEFEGQEDNKPALEIGLANLRKALADV